MDRGYVFGWVFAITVGSLVVAFVIRWALKIVFRIEQMSRAEAFVDQWWVWAPLVTVVVGFWIFAHPIVALVASIGSLVMVRYWARLYPGLQSRRYPDL